MLIQHIGMKPSAPPSNIVACRPAHLVYLSERMRDDEKAQFLAVTGHAEFSADAALAWALGALERSQGYAVTILCDDNLPAAAGGFHPVGPGVWQSWMLGTAEGWQQQWRSMTKITCWLMAKLLEQDAHRLQTSALTTRVKAIEWFERSLSFQPEGVARGYGINGESIANFSRLRGE